MAKKIVFAGLATGIMFLVMRWLGTSLLTSETPLGIMSFELANSYQEAATIVRIIGAKPLQYNIAVDFIFIIAYASFLLLCCKSLMNQYRSSGLKTIGLIFLELSVLVGVLDLVENIAMLITIGGYGSNISVGISRWAAIIKFGLAIFVVFYIVVASILIYYYKKKKS